VLHIWLLNYVLFGSKFSSENPVVQITKSVFNFSAGAQQSLIFIDEDKKCQKDKQE